MDKNAVEPGWPAERRRLGKHTPRIEGALRVTGKARYTSDIKLPGMLWGMILRSPWASAQLESVDLAPARAVPGIRAAVPAQEAPRRLFYYGDEIAAVAGETPEACRQALRAIVLRGAAQPHIVDERKALEPGAARVFPDQENLSAPRERAQGDVEKAFAEAAAVFEGEFSTAIQLHNALETHGNVVAYAPDEITVYASTQGIFSVREGIADAMEVDQSKVRVVSEFMGGGFGAKFGPGVEGVLAARLSKEAGAPVRLMLSRHEEMLAVGNRPSSHQKIKASADREGNLTGFDLVGFGTGGYASGGETEGGGGGAGWPAPYIYRVPNVRVKQYGVAIHAGAGRAMRAPGHPAASFAMEAVMDELAVQLGMDPIAFRLRNDPSELRREQYQLAAEQFGWSSRYAAPGSSPGPLKRGVGCAGATWGGGGSGTRAEAQINPDGTVEVRCGTQDLGTGTHTLIAVVAAEALGLAPHEIQVRLGDTRFPPSGGSGGSTTAPSVSPAVYDACVKARAELQRVSGEADLTGPAWKKAARKLGMTPLVVQGAWREGLSSSGAGGVQMAAVEVDAETGFVRVTEILCVQDCGLVVNPLTCESQIIGGIIMGVGYALYEQRIMDERTGMVLNQNFETYKMPAAADMPRIRITLLDMPERGVIGVGEPVTIPTAAAIGNAVANALGVRIGSIPITPPRVLSALGKTPPAAAEYAPWSRLLAAAPSRP